MMNLGLNSRKVSCSAFISVYLKISESAAEGSLFGSSYMCTETFSLMKLNKSTQWNQLKDENLTAILRLSTSSIKPDTKCLAFTVQVHGRISKL